LSEGEILKFCLSLRIEDGDLSGWQNGEEYVEEGGSATGIEGSGVLAPPLVRSPAPSSNALIVEALKKEGHSEVHTAARERKLSGLPAPWSGGCGLMRSRADASLGLASRADPTLHPEGMDPYLTGSRSE